MRFNLFNFFLAFIFVFILNLQVDAQQLIYNPINPSFVGGNSFNASWLLNQAQVQNKLEDGGADRFERDALTDFKEGLQRSILNQLTRKLYEDTFGEGNLEEGRYEIGDFIIEITQGLDGLNILLIDVLSGNETTLVIPYF